MRLNERTKFLGLAILQPDGSPPLIIGGDGQIYGWHLERPSSNSNRWPRVETDSAGLRVGDASLMNPVARSIGNNIYEEGDVLRFEQHLAVVVHVQISQQGSFSIRLFDFSTAAPQVARLVLLAAIAGASGTPSLILGPTGTGKECIARVIYGARARIFKRVPFVPLNLGGLSRELCASELFGHERGAFTGADRPKAGAFRTAGRGVLFLDELGEAPEDVQVSLLRCLDSGEVRPVGRSDTYKAEALVIAATNREASETGEINGIRFDLVQRLAGLVIRMPPLSNRKDDVLHLANRFVLEHQEKNKGNATLTHGARVLLAKHPWPGNVRELRSVLRRALLFNTRRELGERVIAEMLNIWSAPDTSGSVEDLTHLDQEVLRIAHLNVRERGVARRRLGIPKTTFYRRLKHLNQF